MKTKALGVLAAMLFLGAISSFAADSIMGTWKLNESKSKIPAGATKNSTVTYAQDGDNTKVTIDGTGADGKPTHSEWTGKFDGKDYPVTGDSLSDTRSVKQINDHTFAIVGKKDGKPVLTGKVVVAADGKTRTVTTTTTDSSGKKITSTAVYEKQ